jgi:hypothetical protein
MISRKQKYLRFAFIVLEENGTNSSKPAVFRFEIPSLLSCIFSDTDLRKLASTSVQ